MKLERLLVRNFRNIEACEVTPGKHLNFLVGANGQGKTSILEAIGYLASLRSFRGSKSPEVIRWGSDTAEIAAAIIPETGPETGLNEEAAQSWRTSLRIVFSAVGDDRQRASKTAYINGKPFKSSTQYLTQRFGSFHLGFHAVVFNPSDHDLVRGDPAVRRGYLDRLLAANSVDYLRLVQRYQRVLEQRNAVLKSGDSRTSTSLLSGFTEPLVQLGAQIVHRRLQALEELQKRSFNVLRQIAPNLTFLGLHYLSKWAEKTLESSGFNTASRGVNLTGQRPLPSVEILDQAFRNQLSISGPAEWKAGHSLVGPHRDDWGFILGQLPLKGHGSQGEVRSTLLALKLAEIELFRSETGHCPLFLLDDFSSELDQERRKFLLKALSESDLQVFITTTEERDYEGKRFLISNGSLKAD